MFLGKFYSASLRIALLSLTIGAFTNPLLIDQIVSLFAATFYFCIIALPIKYTRDLRYVDWLVTTPLMISSLLKKASKDKKKAKKKLPVIITLNVCMLVAGYFQQNLLGSVCFLTMLALIQREIDAKYQGLFVAFSILWGSYGLVQIAMQKRIHQNISFTFLDVCTKAIYPYFLTA